MFRPPGTHQYNPKFPKIPLKLNEFESVIYTRCGFAPTEDIRKTSPKDYNLLKQLFAQNKK